MTTRANVRQMPNTRLASAARSVTSPLRGYLNEHFEAVKEDGRERTSRQTAELSGAIASAVEGALLPRIDAIRAEATVLASESLSAITAILDDRMQRVTALETTIAELQATNDQLLAIVAELVKRPDGTAATLTRPA